MRVIFCRAVEVLYLKFEVLGNVEYTADLESSRYYTGNNMVYNKSAHHVVYYYCCLQLRRQRRHSTPMTRRNICINSGN